MRGRIMCGFAVAILSTIFVSCTASIKDIDISQKDPDCARQCTINYSSCVSVPAIGVPHTLRAACKESFEKCIQTCPGK